MTRHDDAGFATLTLVMSTIAMVAVVLSALGAIWMADNVQMSTSGMTAAGSTSQVMSQQFTADVQSATSLTENATAAGCGAGTLVLALAESAGTVAYTEQGSGATTELVRTLCTASGPGSTTVAQNVTAAVALPVTTGTTTTTALQAGWVNASAVGYVTMGLTVTGTNTTVLLTGAPEAGGAL